MSCNGSGRGCAPPHASFIRSTAIGLLGLLAFASTASAQTFTITRAEYSVSDGVGRVRVEGTGTDGRLVTIKNAGNGVTIGTDTVEDGDWRSRLSGLSPVPCRVRAEQAGGAFAERDVANRPANCGPVAGATFSINDVTVSEGNQASFTVTRSGTTTTAVSVVASTAPDTAVATGDFTARTNVTLNFAAGVTTQTFTVATTEDTVFEQTERFFVNLTSPSTGASIADAQGIGTITDDDPQPTGATFSINDVTVTEGGTASFTVTRGGTTTTAVSVQASTANDTAVAPGDFTARSGVTLNFAAGVTTQTFAVTTAQDTAAEATERFFVNLSGASAGASIADAQGIGTINDNDQQAACNPAVNGNHVGCIPTAAQGGYTGPEVCLTCHDAEARQMHGSLHYQQNGPTPFVTNINRNAGEGPAGRPLAVSTLSPPQPVPTEIGINTYCGTHQNSPRFTCVGCHVGNGKFPLTPAELTVATAERRQQELANIDCMMCHQEVYKRFPDFSAGTSAFTNLTLVNVRTNATTGRLESRPCLPGDPPSVCTVTRTGLQGVPNVDALTLDFKFKPAGAPGSALPLPTLPGDPLGAPASAAMLITSESAAENVHPTTRRSCLNCHAGAAGADGAKRGDLSTALWNPPVALDMHMSPDAGGKSLSCSSCHNLNDASGKTLHRVRGRGLDLRANDESVTTRFTCDTAGCHAASPHTSLATISGTSTRLGAYLNRHTAKVACQTCHIPTYGKVVNGVGKATETVRDWQKPHVTDTACNGRGGWLPTETTEANKIPTYQWFNGNSEVYYLGESLANVRTKQIDATVAGLLGMPTTTQAYILGDPLGAANDANAKIYPMKEHWGKLARNATNNTIIPHSTYEFFRTGSFCRAVAVGLGQDPNAQCGTGLNTGVPTGAQVVAVHTFQTINHGVETRASALGAGNTCGTCHDVPVSPFTTGKLPDGSERMNLEGAMGYAVTRTGISVGTNGTSTCNVSCHGTETGNFLSIHERSNHRSAGCNACHSNR